MYKQDLALNKLQGLICNKTQPTNQPNSNKSQFVLFVSFLASYSFNFRINIKNSTTYLP